VHWLDLDQRLQAEPGKAFKLTWKRAGAGGKTESLTADVVQVERKQLDEYDHTVTSLVFGARNDIDRGTGAMTPIEAGSDTRCRARSSAPPALRARSCRSSSRSSAAMRRRMRSAAH